HYVSGAANSIIRSDMPHSTVNIKIDRDGGVVIYTGASDIGQGSDTMVAQVAAETLGCALSRVKVVAADTDLTPIDIGSYSSRVTFMNGNATLRAAQEVKKQIAAAAAKKMNCAVEDRVFREDRVERRSGAPLRSDGSETRPHATPTVSGHVEGQILRGSLRQQRKEEGSGDSPPFEDAVVAADDLPGALSGTAPYPPPK